jgi:hypothetical protein
MESYFTLKLNYFRFRTITQIPKTVQKAVKMYLVPARPRGQDRDSKKNFVHMKKNR